MSKLPLLTAKELIKLLKVIGFEVIRQKGSHVFISHPDGRSTIVPCHQGETISRGLLVKIIKEDVKLSRNEFLDMLN
ncbi:MAG: type II toxin-antitoxin system HicA family toxin [bacterium]|nr:type II toxin-antitoxin system HicA family toxin [bacterium]